MEILRDQKIVELLGCVHRAIMPYYLHYADKDRLLNLEGFQRFCSDFDLFPAVLSKPRLYRFFRSLAKFFEQTAGEAIRKSKLEVIDEHLFVEALALTAFEVGYSHPQPTNAEKIILLMEKLNQSGGLAKV